MEPRVGNQRIDRLGQKVLWTLVILGIACVLAPYAYWPVLKAIGTLVYGEFHFAGQCPVIHGGMPFEAVVVLSPLTVPYHVLDSTTASTIVWIEEFRYTWDEPGATAVVLGSLFVALVISSLVVWMIAVLAGLVRRRVKSWRSEVSGRVAP